MVVRRHDRLLVSFASLGILVLFLTACSGSSGSPEVEATLRAETEQAVAGENMDIDEQLDEGMLVEHVQVEPPAEFEGLTNPFSGDPEAITEGARVFAGSCASCHGETGMGDGPISVTLNPKPAALGDPEMMADMSDGYIFWRIYAGGAMEPFNSAMPAWNFFSEDQIWQLISFIRTLGG